VIAMPNIQPTLMDFATSSVGNREAQIEGDRWVAIAVLDIVLFAEVVFVGPNGTERALTPIYVSSSVLAGLH